MAFRTVKQDLSNEALYWVEKVIIPWMVGGGYTMKVQIIPRVTITPPRTDDHREIEKFNRLISRRVSDLTSFIAQQNIAPVENVTQDAMFWIERRAAWHQVL